MAPTPTVAAETPGDAAAIAAVHRAAFSTDDEATLVARLRARDSFDPSLSLVARRDGEVVGHVLLSPLGVDGAWNALVLAPLAVTPVRQGEGVGSALVEASLSRVRRGDWDAVFLHGAPAFYSRFGFQPAGQFGFENPFETPSEEFMIALLTDESPPGGRLTYPSPFDAL